MINTTPPPDITDEEYLERVGIKLPEDQEEALSRVTKIFADTETTGFPSSKLTLAQSPHLVQLGVLATDDDGCPLIMLNSIVRPEGWEIPSVAASIHGITTDIALKKGRKLRTVMSEFESLLERVDYGKGCVVFHNAHFDTQILDISFQRVEELHNYFGEYADEMEVFCTMLATKGIVKATDKRGRLKSPNLREAHEFFLGKERSDIVFGPRTEEYPQGLYAHNAFVDVVATKEIFFASRL